MELMRNFKGGSIRFRYVVATVYEGIVSATNVNTRQTGIKLFEQSYFTLKKKAIVYSRG